MKYFFVFIPLIFILVSLGGCAGIERATQYPNSNPSLDDKLSDVLTEEQRAITALKFLTGDWHGPGISYGQDGSQTPYYDKEFVRFDLNNSLLLINAQGERPDGTISYNLHTVIHYDAQAKNYVYTPYTSKGNSREFRCDLNAKQTLSPQFICYTADKTYRLTFQRLKDGNWNEFGEKYKNGAWQKNFETILKAR